MALTGDNLELHEFIRGSSQLFDAYEQEGFAPVFWSQGGDYPQYHGKPFTVVELYPDEIVPSVMRGCGCPEEYLKKD